MIHNHDRFNAMSSRVASRLYASYSQMPDASTREAYLAMVTGSTPDVIKAHGMVLGAITERPWHGLKRPSGLGYGMVLRRPIA